MGAVMFQLFVPGVPAAQGSKRHVGKGIMVESSSRVKPWRDLIVSMALDALTNTNTFNGPVTVDLIFFLPRPRSHYGTGRNADVLKESAPRWPTTKPDIDKTSRAVLDALGLRHGAGVIADDSNVTDLHATKVYGPPGVQIIVKEML